ncbi:contractile injection system tape measure protein [Duganella sp. CF517]|uniref:contractile injection system tape measure protein n=1 Tax=Duganella sp. CF517 TaxID=1881038 RepID=UPI000B13EAE0|nr:contractile injection system tape measure protein [Duganella sp. CF517]
MKTTHRIADLHLDLSFESDDPRPQPMAEDDLMALAREYLLSTLADTLEREDDSRHRHIARLDIDLGECEAHDYAAEIPPLLARLLREALARHDDELASAPQGGHAAGPAVNHAVGLAVEHSAGLMAGSSAGQAAERSAKPAARQSAGTAARHTAGTTAVRREPLEHFLLRGLIPVLPGNVGAATQAAHERLLALSLASPAADDLKALLRRCATSPEAVRRLAQQFEPASLRRLVLRVEAPAKAAMWLSLLDDIDAALRNTGAARRYDLRQFWEILLTDVLGGAASVASMPVSTALREAIAVALHTNNTVAPQAAALLRTIASDRLAATATAPNASASASQQRSLQQPARTVASSSPDDAERYSAPGDPLLTQQEHHAVPPKQPDPTATTEETGETLWTAIERHITATAGAGATLMLTAIRASAGRSADRLAFIERVAAALRQDQVVDLEEIESAITAARNANIRRIGTAPPDMEHRPDAIPSASPAPSAPKITPAPKGLSELPPDPILLDAPAPEVGTAYLSSVVEDVTQTDSLIQALLDADVARVSSALVGTSQLAVLGAIRDVGARSDVWHRVAHFPPTLLLQLTWAASPQATNILLTLQSVNGEAPGLHTGTKATEAALNDPSLWQRCLIYLASKTFEPDSFRTALRPVTAAEADESLAAPAPATPLVPSAIVLKSALQSSAPHATQASGHHAHSEPHLSQEERPAPPTPGERNAADLAIAEPNATGNAGQVDLLREALLEANQARVDSALAATPGELVLAAMRQIGASSAIWLRVARFSPALLTRMIVAAAPPARSILLSLQSSEGGAPAPSTIAASSEDALDDPLLWQRCLRYLASTAFEADGFSNALRSMAPAEISVPTAASAQSDHLLPPKAILSNSPTQSVVFDATRASHRPTQPQQYLWTNRPLAASSGEERTAIGPRLPESPAAASAKQSDLPRQVWLNADEARGSLVSDPALVQPTLDVMRQIGANPDILRSVAPRALPGPGTEPDEAMSSGAVSAEVVTAEAISGDPGEPRLSGAKTDSNESDHVGQRHLPISPSDAAGLAASTATTSWPEALWHEVNALMTARSAATPATGRPGLLALAVRSHATESRNPGAFLQAVLAALRDKQLLDLDHIEEQIGHAENPAIQPAETADASSILRRIEQQLGALTGSGSAGSSHLMMEAISAHAEHSPSAAAYLLHVLEDIMESRPIDLEALDMLYGQLAEPSQTGKSVTATRLVPPPSSPTTASPRTVVPQIAERRPIAACSTAELPSKLESSLAAIPVPPRPQLSAPMAPTTTAAAAAAAADAAHAAALDAAHAAALDAAHAAALDAAHAAVANARHAAADAAHVTVAHAADAADAETVAATTEAVAALATATTTQAPANATLASASAPPTASARASLPLANKAEIVELHSASPRRAAGGQLAQVLARHVPARRAALTAMVREAADDIAQLTPAMIQDIIKLLVGSDMQTKARYASEVCALAAQHLPGGTLSSVEFETDQFDLDWFFIQGKNFTPATYAHALAAWLSRNESAAAPLHEALHNKLGIAQPAAPPPPPATRTNSAGTTTGTLWRSPASAGTPAEPDIVIDALIVDNAGQVLIGPYMPRLFSTLGLTEANQFKNAEAAERAVHLLQCVVGGPSDTPEALLGLNKILCGVPAATAIAREVAITDQERDTVEMMLRAIIEHWKKIGNTTPDGLRQSFLRRTGRMHLKDDAWYLDVDPGTFDMLLDSLPWSFSIIKHPWMERAVHVNWR